MPIDYSKWDKILDDMSCNSDDDSNNATTNPGVTQLDGPSRVTFGGGGGTGSVRSRAGGGQQQTEENVIRIEPSATTSTMTPSSSATVSTDSLTTTQRPSSSTTKRTVATNNTKIEDTDTNTISDDMISSWTEKGGSIILTSNDNLEGQEKTKDTACHSHNHHHRQLYWCQDRYSVTIRIQLLSSLEKGKHVHVKGILSYSDRHCAMGSIKPNLKVTISTTKPQSPTSIGRNDNEDTVILEGELPHHVHKTQESEDDDNDDQGFIDWTVEENMSQQARQQRQKQDRYLVVTLYKAVPMQGLFVWWKRPLMQFKEITINNDNNHGNDSPGSNSNNTNASQEFLNAWEEAHRLFREKRMAERANKS